MKKIIMLSLILALNFNAWAQDQSVLKIYNQSIELIKILEKNGFELVRTEMDILSKGDKIENTRRTLYPDYEYSIMVYRDKNMEDINLEVYEMIDDEWTFIEAAKAIEGTDEIKSLTIRPTETKSYLFKVFTTGFENGSITGRYTLMVGHLGEISSAEKTRSDNNEREYVFRANSHLIFEKKNNEKGFSKETVIEKPSTVEVNFEEEKIRFTSGGYAEDFFFTDNRIGDDEDDKLVKIETLDVNGKKWVFNIDLEESVITFHYIKNRNMIAGRAMVYAKK